MRRLVSFILLFALTSCGDIDYHTRSAEQLETMAGYPAVGYATWTSFSCDVYLLPEKEYPSIACYSAVIAHEERHCQDHHFHPNTPEGSVVPECNKGNK